jgi:glycosyltransferase involved in cell wall biosynthesis
MGRISPEKGLDRLIVQCAALPDTRWSLSIAGSGEPAYIASLKALAEGLPVEFVGVVEPSRFLRNIDILIIPSLWHDPAPRVVYEAGLHGVIPLVSNRGGLPELVDFGRRGLVFDLNDNMGLALAINKMIEDPAIVGKMRAAWEEVRSNFSSKSVARETLSIYEAVTTRSM